MAQILESIDEIELPLARLPADVPRASGARGQMEFSWTQADGSLLPLDVTEMSLLTALAALLYRYLGQDSLAFEYSTSGSIPPRFVRVSGLSGQATGRELEHLVAFAQSGERARDHAKPTPLGLIHRSRAAGAESEIERELGQFSEGRELALIVAEGEREARIGVAFDSSLYKKSTVLRFAMHFARLVSSLGAAPELGLGQHALLTESELLERHAWRSREMRYPTSAIHLKFSENARATPDAPAAFDDESRLSYRELDDRACSVAQLLRDRGVSPGDRVVVCLDPSNDVLVAMLGIFKVGGVYVPVAPEYPSERLRVMIEDTQPALVITRARCEANLPAGGPPRFDLGSEGSLGRVEGLVAHEPEPSDIAYIIYTSGTTGMPKGVMISHHNLIQYVHSAAERFGFRSSDCFAALARPTFSISFFELLVPLWLGGSVRIVTREHALDFRRFTTTLREITVMHASPSLLRQFVVHLEQVDPKHEAVSSLRHVSSGGDLVAPDLQEALKKSFPGAELFVIYGCSEISCMGCAFEIPRDAEVTKSYVGTPFDNVSVDVVDDAGHGCPIGVVGEIVFSGDGVGLGYFNRPELTNERFVQREGRRSYRTGDVGRFNEFGQVEILGRSDFQVKLRGVRIEPGEVEFAIRALPGVRDVVVSCRKLLSGEDGLVAYLVLSGVAEPIPDIRKKLEAKLPDYMVPSVFVRLDALPVNVNNKVDRRSLPAPRAEDYRATNSYTPPRTETEKHLVRLWESLLDLRPVGISERFFDLGGTSLLVLSMMVRIEEALGVTLPLSALLIAPTIEELARRIDSGGDPTGSDPVLLRPGAGKTPVFFVHDGDGEVMPYHTLAQQIAPGHPVYGLPPIGRAGHVMVQTRLAEVAKAYVESVKKIQPEGPYLLGGLCIGGFVAFEMARQLTRSGDEIGVLALFDAAYANAEQRSLAKRRMNQFVSVFGSESRGLSSANKVWGASKKAVGKVRNLVVYEGRTRARRALRRAKILALRYAIDHDRELPAFARGLTVDDVLRFAEHEYPPPPVYEGRVHLMLATKKDPIFDGTEVNDTPYQDLFVQKHLGWDGRATDLHVREVSGGHSSMLQLPNVLQIAETIQAEIDRVEKAKSRP